jgi:hypothetical protein
MIDFFPDDPGPFSGLGLRDKIPGGLGREAIEIMNARWTADDIHAWDNCLEKAQWTRPSVPIPAPIWLKP